MSNLSYVSASNSLKGKWLVDNVTNDFRGYFAEHNNYVGIADSDIQEEQVSVQFYSDNLENEPSNLEKIWLVLICTISFFR